MDQNHLINLFFFFSLDKTSYLKIQRRDKWIKEKMENCKKEKKEKRYSSKTRQTFFVTTYVLHFNSNLQ